jgi:8-oxo-dGTP pyrophosphatase MutT (NUDIX family)
VSGEVFFQTLSKRLQQKLPGIDAHQELAPYKGRLSSKPDSSTRQAAVCILICKQEHRYYFPLIKRKSNNPNDPHQGQIGLPGGRYEETDPDLWYTAIRETEEEIGVNRLKIQKIGALSPLFIPVSGNEVFPFVGWLEDSASFKLQTQEIESLFEWDISHFTHQSAIEHRNLKSSPIKIPVPGFTYPPHFIWGATSMILQELKMVMQEIMPEIGQIL